MASLPWCRGSQSLDSDSYFDLTKTPETRDRKYYDKLAKTLNRTVELVDAGLGPLQDMLLK